MQRGYFTERGKGNVGFANLLHGCVHTSWGVKHKGDAGSSRVGSIAQHFRAQLVDAFVARVKLPKGFNAPACVSSKAHGQIRVQVWQRWGEGK